MQFTGWQSVILDLVLSLEAIKNTHALDQLAYCKFISVLIGSLLVYTHTAAFLTQTVNLDDTTVKFEIWDTAGQERYHSLAPMYYRGAQAAIVVYDITNMVGTRTCHIAKYCRGKLSRIDRKLGSISQGKLSEY